MTLVSILVPLYNEEEFVGELLKRVIAAPLQDGLDREIIVVDDKSTDASVSIVEALSAQYPGMIRLLRHEHNQGKGAAIRTALNAVRGEYCLIQDADLEYDPREYPRLLGPLLDGEADAVYGSRFLSGERRRVLYYWHSVANGMLTTLCNMASDLNLTDMETCYKAFRSSLIKSIPLRSNRFGIEPEVTIKLAKRHAKVYEVPISYNGRTYDEGKKIGLKDAVQAVYIIFRYWLTSDLYKDHDKEILDAFSVAPRFNRWMAGTIRPYVGKRVLEIGAGMGNLTRQMIRGRERYVATDIDLEHLDRLRSRLSHRPVLETAVCDLSNSAHFTAFAGAMDTVVCLNVLEHLKDDKKCLRNIFSILAPQGRAVVLVPCDQGLYGKLDEILGHERRYTADELRARMEEAGFRVETVLNFNHISRPGWYVSGKLLRRSRISRLQLKIFDRLMWLWPRIDNWLPWGPTSIIGIGVREK
jgi:glycosyltransferase involved in cell wall biosynthesis